MSEFITRAYNTFKINKHCGTITKYSKDTKMKDEIGYFYEISDYPELIKYFPRTFSRGQEESSGKYFIEMEFINYKNLGEYLLSGAYTEYEWIKIINQLCNVILEFKKHHNNDNSYSTAFEKMYIDKTLIEYNKFRESKDVFYNLTKDSIIYINKKKYNNFNIIRDRVIDLIHKKLIGKNKITIIHGDFCFSNIISSINIEKDITCIRLIDPRGSWGQRGIFGDCRYDIAKLYHSFDGGYEYFINDAFIISCNKNEYTLQYKNTNKDIVKRLFQTHLIPKFEFDESEYNLIQGLIFIGMCARHYDSQSRQIAMYLTGVKILNEVIEKCK